MLKLVYNRHTANPQNSIDETESNPSHQYIDQLMNQIKYVHLSEVWQARLKELSDVANTAHKSKKNHLKVL